MMLETLFAHQQQEEAFLTLAVCGLALGMMIHLSVVLRRRHAVLSAIVDALTAFLFAGMFFLTMLKYQGGFRAYGLLGVLLGVLLYLAGLAQPLSWLASMLKKDRQSSATKQENPPPAGNPTIRKHEER